MKSTYAQKSSTVQKIASSNATSVLDSSSQGESLQRHADMASAAAQRAEAPRPNNTGMPDNLKSGIESLSGFSMDDVRVHYNSSKPATVQALAYTQGTDIHVAPGQEKHLPHEAWHVAQQMAGRVSPTTNINGMPVNDNTALEHEAEVMGEKAMSCCSNNVNQLKKQKGFTYFSQNRMMNSGGVTQCLFIKENFSQYKRRIRNDLIFQVIENFWFDHEINLMIRYFNNYCGEKEKKTLRDIVVNIKELREKKDRCMVSEVDKLVFYINDNFENLPKDKKKQLVGYFSKKYESGYSDGARNVDGFLSTKEKLDWNNQSEALEEISRDLGGETTLPQNRALSNIPVIPWSIAKKKIPTTLMRLIRDIYISWFYGSVMDCRSLDEQKAKKLNCDTPGALRSWHVNQSETLPDLGEVKIPGNARYFHDHYQATSNIMNIVRQENPNINGPVGFAEYTGTGLGGNHDDCKIVLDYLKGCIYITLTHYQFWEDGYTLSDQGQLSGTHNPWFKIDMEK